MKLCFSEANKGQKDVTGMEENTLVIEVLKLLLSWPVVAGVLGFMVLCTFKSDIRQFVGRLGWLKLGQFEASQQAITSPNRVNPVDNSSVKTESDRSNSEYWEFMYFNLFLVPNSKRFLLWVAQRKSVPEASCIAEFDLMLPLPFPELEKKNILMTLLAVGLLRADGSSVEVTDKGNNYLRFLGFRT